VEKNVPENENSPNLASGGGNQSIPGNLKVPFVRELSGGCIRVLWVDWRCPSSGSESGLGMGVIGGGSGDCLSKCGRSGAHSKLKL